MGDLIMKYLQGGGHLAATQRCIELIDGLVGYPDYNELNFYIGACHEDQIMHRYYQHGRPQTFMLYRTQSRRNIRLVETALIAAYRNIHPRNVNDNAGGGAGIGEAGWYNIYIHFRNE